MSRYRRVEPLKRVEDKEELVEITCCLISATQRRWEEKATVQSASLEMLLMSEIDPSKT